jgi:hypothetical protein
MFSVKRINLRIEKSQACRLGHVTTPTEEFPRRVLGAGANAAGFSQRNSSFK